MTAANSTQAVSPHQPKIPAENPYRALLAQSPHNDARSLYSAHRTARSTAQRALVLDPAVSFKTDPVLSAILQHDPPDFSIDTRHNLTSVERPCWTKQGLMQAVSKWPIELGHRSLRTRRALCLFRETPTKI